MRKGQAISINHSGSNRHTDTDTWKTAEPISLYLTSTCYKAPTALQSQRGKHFRRASSTGLSGRDPHCVSISTVCGRVALHLQWWRKKQHNNNWNSPACSVTLSCACSLADADIHKYLHIPCRNVIDPDRVFDLSPITDRMKLSNSNLLIPGEKHSTTTLLDCLSRNDPWDT